MTRDEIVRFFLNKEDLGLEIGAGYNPAVPKAEGWNVETIDHLPQAELIEKMRAHGVDVSKIEYVDHVWRGEPLDDLVPPERRGTYRYVVASHVIEHVPDLIAFFNAVERLLGDDGVVSLVIPDKRHCFDFFRPLTSTGDLLDARARGRTRHSRKIWFDQVAYASRRSGSIAWDASQTGEIALAHDFSDARRVLEAYSDDAGDYIDMHHWTFVPSSFELIVAELRALGLMKLDVARTFPGAGCEFYVALRKSEAPPCGGTELAEKRLGLLRATARELATIANV